MHADKEMILAIHRSGLQVQTELGNALEKFPRWPTDMFHAFTVVSEEYGEIAKAILQYHYEPNKNVTLGDIHNECIQTIAMLHRFLNHLDSYNTLAVQA